ncbi:hypothetical protein OGAPHI_001848 [Ogataea philodendri]|uniref:GB1/RHD3-type G domain-containing protein n=1 Tax=Ogataea philodendri TaxID=1378263 RepID=A0A9P8PAV0_9ASCO|nr:uncharacterized protein OGAPHI_001848 [Ogataea philodendri]KAH3668094.1 hypothetical protein OGAPHI_001848 [Ogataea philodendri]
MSSLQLIDENKNFNEHLLPYIQKYYDGKDDKGLNYHIVSVFGSQSTGKSTLLNRLFGTQFDVMDETKRQQTTKGIWISHANYIASTLVESGRLDNENHLFVLDVEGVDGREKADDKDFERKSALFALSTSEVLIVNIWEHQVGLYQGANMELLKTVFEVNLSLFSSSKQKCLLLFVIRDFTDMTPIENLSNSLMADLNKIWSSLSKPESCQDLTITDFFDLKFTSIAHKHFQPDKFEHDIQLLGDRFASTELFKNEYHRNIPIDAWTIYMDQIWQQIEENKDLDLPTQQILVARFRCDEIMLLAYQNFEEQYEKVDFEKLDDPQEFADSIKQLRTEALVPYDTSASRYTQTVYLERREQLAKKIDSKLTETNSRRLASVIKKLVKEFSDRVQAAKKNHEGSLKEILAAQTALVTASFREDAGKCMFDHSQELEQLETEIQAATEQIRRKEKSLLVSRLTKRFQSQFKEKLTELCGDPTDDLWDKVMVEFSKIEDGLESKFLVDGVYDYHLGLDAKENAELHIDLQKAHWSKFRDIVHDYVTEDTVSRILRNKFEDLFRYDEQGVPKMWTNTLEIDQQYNKAREAVLKLLPTFSRIVLAKTNEEVVPPVNISSGEFEDLDEEDEEVPFAELLSTRQQTGVLGRVRKEMDAIYIEAKRSVMSSMTSIPFWMYCLVVALGWNEFMAVLRNPLFFMLLILIATGTYFAHQTGLLKPMLTVARSTISQSKTVAKQKLRELIEENEPEKVETKEVNSKAE